MRHVGCRAVHHQPVRPGGEPVRPGANEGPGLGPKRGQGSTTPPIRVRHPGPRARRNGGERTGRGPCVSGPGGSTAIRSGLERAEGSSGSGRHAPLQAAAPPKGRRTPTSRGLRDKSAPASSIFSLPSSPPRLPFLLSLPSTAPPRRLHPRQLLPLPPLLASRAACGSACERLPVPRLRHCTAHPANQPTNPCAWFRFGLHARATSTGRTEVD